MEAPKHRKLGFEIKVFTSPIQAPRDEKVGGLGGGLDWNTYFINEIRTN